MRRQLPTSEPQELGPERAEPRLFPVNPAPPPSPPATANPGILSATRDDEPKPSNSAAILAPGRRPAAAVGRRARSLLYVALAGFAFVAVAGYLWFTAPPRTTVPASDSSASEPSQAVRIPEPIPHEAKTSLPAAPAVTPGGPDEKPAAAADATPKSAGEADQPSPPVSAEVSSGQPANPQSSPAGPAGVAAGPPSPRKISWRIIMRRVRRTAITDPTTLEARHGIPILGLRVNPGGRSSSPVPSSTRCRSKLSRRLPSIGSLTN